MEKIHVLQITVNKQKETFPIDADFSEKHHRMAVDYQPQLERELELAPAGAEAFYPFY